jgi:hypothetical protein
MRNEALAANKVCFRNERSISPHGDSNEESYMCSVELVENHVTLTLDGSEYCFTAQQCAEVVIKLSKMLLVYSSLGICQASAESTLQLDAYASRCGLIEAQTFSNQHDSLQTYESEAKGYEFCASGTFRSPVSQHSEPYYYKLVICLNDDLQIPCLGIDGWSYSLSFEEALWLVEQLCIAGSLVDGTEQEIDTGTQTAWINDEGQLMRM